MDTISMRTTEVNVNGTRIEGWSDGECFTPPQEAEIARIRRGADGFKARFATGELGGPVMLSLLPTSPSAIFLNNLFQEARTAGAGGNVEGGGESPEVIEMDVNYADIGVTMTCREGGFLKGPFGISGGDGDFGNLKWTIEFEDIETDTSGSSQGSPSGGGGRPDTPINN